MKTIKLLRESTNCAKLNFIVVVPVMREQEKTVELVGFGHEDSALKKQGFKS